MPDDSARDDLSFADPPAFHSDTLLLAGVAARQPAALQELYDRYSPIAYALALRMLRDPLAAEACVQTVFLGLWQHPPGADPGRREWSAELLRAVQLQARTQQRSRRPGRRPPAPVVPPPPAGALPPSGPGRFAARHRLAEQQQAARTALARLPPIQRAVLELAYFDGLTASEIAAALQESRATIDGHLQAGLWQLRAARRPPAGARPERDPLTLVSPSVGPPAGPPPAPGPLTAALALMQAAQQHAADVRYHARILQQQAHTTQQHAATVQQRADTSLRQLQVLQELYAYLALQLQDGAVRCAEDFTQTEAYFAQHAQQIDVRQVAAVLAVLNARCDCDVYRLLPTLIS
ncbi:MAG TPA: sigma-70 family RNA polymerase sigma factor [Chloroflexia bacterium]|nr:sigma-70 family RNA polymerase sigma factor [Chloroflexia bacterium]